MVGLGCSLGARFGLVWKETDLQEGVLGWPLFYLFFLGGLPLDFFVFWCVCFFFFLVLFWGGGGLQHFLLGFAPLPSTKNRLVGFKGSRKSNISTRVVWRVPISRSVFAWGTEREAKSTLGVQIPVDRGEIHSTRRAETQGSSIPPANTNTNGLSHGFNGFSHGLLGGARWKPVSSMVSKWCAAGSFSSIRSLRDLSGSAAERICEEWGVAFVGSMIWACVLLVGGFRGKPKDTTQSFGNLGVAILMTWGGGA